jgi:curli production assembly/transport component CsgG
MNAYFLRRAGWMLLAACALSSCSTVPPSNTKTNAQLTPSTRVTRELAHLPAPKTKIAVAVYGLRDQTGQYKASPESPYSTQVTQGAASMLVEALRDSGWYLPVEREGLQNLLTERRIVRAIESPADKGKATINLPNLLPASLIIEGGVIAYESNVRTGGKGANYLGVGASTQYSVDQVTVGLRSIDIRTGQVLDTVSVTKTIYSYAFDANVYRYVSYMSLLQAEAGYTTNEPQQLALREAIQSAVIHLTAKGVRDRYLELRDPLDWNNPIIQSYLREDAASTREDAIAEDESIPMEAFSSETPPAVRPLVLASDAAKPAPDISALAAAAATALGASAKQAAPAQASVQAPAQIPLQASAQAHAQAPAQAQTQAPAPAQAQAQAPAPAQAPARIPAQAQAQAQVHTQIPPVQIPAPTPTPALAPVQAPTPAPAPESAPPAATAHGKQGGSDAVKNASPSDDIFKQYWQGAP